MIREMVEGIIFDWSGTLCDDFKASFVATRRTIRHFGGPTLKLSEYREHLQIPVAPFYRRYLPKTSIQQIDRHYFKLFATRETHLALFSQVKEFLAWCRHKRIKLFLLTTVPEELVAAWAEMHHIRFYFWDIKGGVRDKSRPIVDLIAQYGLNPAKTIFLGDMPHDILAANKAGALSAAVLAGYGRETNLIRSAPRFVFRDLGGLFTMLKRCDRRLDHRPADRSSVVLKPVATVGALVFHRDKILLVQTHKWHNTWGIPGGKIEGGETLTEAVTREVHEEVGVRIKNIRHILTQEYVDSGEFYHPAHFILVNFAAEAGSEAVTLNEEAESYLWIHPRQVPYLKLNGPTRALLEHLPK